MTDSLGAPRRSARALLLLGSIVAACTAGGDIDRQGEPSAATQWSYDTSMLYPPDRSLNRPEDGVALSGGRLLVADQVHGLRLVRHDGTSVPFGEMAAAGYSHRPPERSGAANGVSLEPGGGHVLVSDAYGGGIYRVDVATGRAEKIYQHDYGVNAAVRDATGAIWFTQSTRNPPDSGEQRLYGALDVPVADGALLRLPMESGRPITLAETVVDSLYFANGVALDERRGLLYVSEMMAARVLRFRVELATGRLSDRHVLLDGIFADNLEVDDEGQLWMAIPLTSEVVVVDPSGERRVAFTARSATQDSVVAEFIRRGRAGQPRLELFTPSMWAPLPWPLTGVIVGGRETPVYITGLGDALLMLPR